MAAHGGGTPHRTSRRELDRLVEQHHLQRPAVEALFGIAGARPTPEEDRRLIRRTLQLAGSLFLAAAVIFFVAANWREMGIAGRFALLHALLVATVGVAMWRPPPLRLGRLAVLGSFLVTGALLALFGQTYQTGADVHELFFAWAGLGLPLVLAGQWAVTWAAWALVLDVAFALLCGWLPGTHVLWSVLDPWGLAGYPRFALPLAVNLALWIACQAAAGTRVGHVAAPWLGRFLVAAGIGFGTWGAVLAVAPFHGAAGQEGRALLLALLAVAAAGVAWHTLRERRDVFPLATLAAGVIAFGTALLARALTHGDAAPLFAMAAWLVVGSTSAGWLIMDRLRRWREDRRTA